MVWVGGREVKKTGQDVSTWRNRQQLICASKFQTAKDRKKKKAEGS